VLNRSCSARSQIAGRLLIVLFMGTLFFSGVEKVLAGWPFQGAISRLRRYPDHALLRGWTVGAFGGDTTLPGYLLEWVTLVIELGVPMAIAFRRVRWLALGSYLLLFLGITAVIEAPLLFSALYLGMLPLLVTFTRPTVSAAATEESKGEQCAKLKNRGRAAC
jgi:hypothetical protein